jgi:hypothetical protein
MKQLNYDTVSRLLARALGLTLEELEESLRPAREEDLDGIIALRGQHEKIGHRHDDHAYLTWRYQFKEKGWKRQIWIFVLRGEVVGTTGIERDYLRYKGVAGDVYKVMDILVREDLMMSGLGVWIALRLRKFFDNTFCIGSTKYSHSIVTKLNKPLPTWQSWRYPIRLQHFRGRRFGVKPLNLLLRIRDIFKPRGVPPGYQFSIRNAPDAATDELYESMTEYSLMPSRNLDKYAWRFGKHPYLNARYFKLKTGGRLMAQAAVTGAPHRRAVVYDMLVRHDGDKRNSSRTLSLLLPLVINTLAAEGIDVVSTRVNDSVSAAALSRAGFILRDDPGPIGYHFMQEELDTLLRQGVPFFLMPTDADYD